MHAFQAGFFLVTLLNLLLLLAWPLLSFTALFSLRKTRLPETVRALWALIILAIPLMGALAFWVVAPKDSPAGE